MWVNGSRMTPFEVKAKVIALNPTGPTWTINCTTPEGQGLANGIQLVRDGSPSFITASVDYLGPTLTGWAPCAPLGDPAGWSCGPMQLLGPGVIATAPTVGGRIRLFGDNLGTCPDVYAVYDRIQTCYPGAIPGVYTPNPAVNRRCVAVGQAGRGLHAGVG
jgi:hypothetical protein